jgi:hypothetical protein
MSTLRPRSFGAKGIALPSTNVISPFLTLVSPASDWQLSSSQITAFMDCGRSTGFLAIMAWYATSSDAGTSERAEWRLGAGRFWWAMSFLIRDSPPNGGRPATRK